MQLDTIVQADALEFMQGLEAQSVDAIMSDMPYGTTALVAIQNDRHYIGSELNAEYVEMARQRIAEFNPYQPSDQGNGITQLSLFGD